MVPAATVTLGGLNFFHNTHQQEVLDEQQESLDSLTTALAALTKRVEVEEAETGGTDTSGKHQNILDGG